MQLFWEREYEDSPTALVHTIQLGVQKHRWTKGRNVQAASQLDVMFAPSDPQEFKAYFSRLLSSGLRFPYRKLDKPLLMLDEDLKEIDVYFITEKFFSLMERFGTKFSSSFSFVGPETVENPNTGDDVVGYFMIIPNEQQRDALSDMMLQFFYGWAVTFFPENNPVAFDDEELEIFLTLYDYHMEIILEDSASSVQDVTPSLAAFAIDYLHHDGQLWVNELCSTAEYEKNLATMKQLGWRTTSFTEEGVST